MTEFMTQFHFMRPEWLLLLIPTLIFAGLTLRHTLNRGSWDQHIDPALQDYMLDQTSENSRKGITSLLGLLWIVAVLALAGPTWERKPVPLVSNPHALVILMDMSLSMKAQDIAPDRAVRAIRKATDIMRAREDGVTAVIAYAGDAHTVVPFTDDSKTIEHLLQSLSPEIMPKLGSRPDKAIEQASKLMTDAGVNKADFLMITDGIQNRDIDRIQAVLPNQVKLSAIVVGTAEGAPIPVGDQGFLKDDSGTIVLPRLDTQPFNNLYDTVGSPWRMISYDDSDWRSMISVINPEDIGEEQEQTLEVWEDAGYWLIFLLLPVALYNFRRGAVFMLALGLYLATPQPAWADMWETDNQKAYKLMETDPAQAAELFSDPMWQGTAHFRAGNYEAAEQAFSQSDSAVADYNRGNAMAAQNNLDGAIAAYENALEKQPDFPEAQKNLDLANKLKEQQEQQQNQDGESGDDSQQSDENSEQNSNQNSEQNSEQNSDSDSDSSQNSSNNSSDSNSNSSSDSSQKQNSEDSSSQQADEDYAEQQAQKQAQQQSQEQNQQQNKQASAGKESDEQKDDAGEEKQSSASKDDEKNGDEESESQQMQSQKQESSQRQEQQQSQMQNQPDAMDSENMSMSREQQAAIESLLNEVPDNPGMLMKRKFLYQYRQSADQNEEEVLW